MFKHTFYLTFGQDNPLRDHWIEVTATDYNCARHEVEKVFGNHWSHLYTQEEWIGSEGYLHFKYGKFIQTMEAA